MRILAGVLALVAMALSFTETVLASTCVPVSEIAAHGTVSGDDSSQECVFLTGRHEAGDRNGEDRDDRCPLSPAMGCAAATSLPALPSAMSAATVEAASPIVSDEIRIDLFLAQALFRPPRA